jgi:hypothetical protein
MACPLHYKELTQQTPNPAHSVCCGPWAGLPFLRSDMMARAQRRIKRDHLRVNLNEDAPINEEVMDWFRLLSAILVEAKRKNPYRKSELFEAACDYAETQQ